jgi:hypothetical protein
LSFLRVLAALMFRLRLKGERMSGRIVLVLLRFFTCINIRRYTTPSFIGFFTILFIIWIF